MLKSSSTPAPNQIFTNISTYQLFLNCSAINIMSLIIFYWREGLSYTQLDVEQYLNLQMPVAPPPTHCQMSPGDKTATGWDPLSKRKSIDNLKTPGLSKLLVHLSQLVGSSLPGSREKYIFMYSYFISRYLGQSFQKRVPCSSEEWQLGEQWC